MDAMTDEQLTQAFTRILGNEKNINNYYRLLERAEDRRIVSRNFDIQTKFIIWVVAVLPQIIVSLIVSIIDDNLKSGLVLGSVVLQCLAIISIIFGGLIFSICGCCSHRNVGCSYFYKLTLNIILHFFIIACTIAAIMDIIVFSSKDTTNAFDKIEFIFAIAIIVLFTINLFNQLRILCYYLSKNKYVKEFTCDCCTCCGTFYEEDWRPKTKKIAACLCCYTEAEETQRINGNIN